MRFFDKAKGFFDDEDEINEEDTSKKDQNKDSYSVRVICKNCKHKQTISIPKRKKVKEIIKDRECEKCGLKDLKMKKNQKNDDFFDDFVDIYDLDDKDSFEDLKDGTVPVTVNISPEHIEDLEKFILDLTKKKLKNNKKRGKTRN